MAKFDFRGLIPGKRYKIVVIPDTAYGEVRSLPAIDFIVPEAPPRARNSSLDVKRFFRTKIIGYKNRKLRIWQYRIIANPDLNAPVGQKKIAIIVTGKTAPGKNNRVKPGDKIKVKAPTAIATGSEAKTVISRDGAPLNRIKYFHPNDSATLVGWTKYTTDDNVSSDSFPVVHVNGGAAIIKKIPVARIRIPKIIMENLVWNDTVRDVVHIIYRKAKNKANISGKRRYVFYKDGDLDLIVDPLKPIQDGSNGFNLEDFTDGMPPVFKKEINDEKYYSFEFIVARYIRRKEDDTYTPWKGYWIERDTPFAKRISRPTGWKA